MKGVMNLRGTIVPVVDLRAKFLMPEAEYNQFTVIIVVTVGAKVMGVARTTFIIGPDGKIRHVFHKVKPEGHSEEVLAYLKQAA